MFDLPILPVTEPGATPDEDQAAKWVCCLQAVHCRTAETYINYRSFRSPSNLSRSCWSPGQGYNIRPNQLKLSCKLELIHPHALHTYWYLPKVIFSRCYLAGRHSCII